MAKFISWRHEYERAKDALATRSWDAYFKASIENSKEMRTTFTTLGSIQKFVEWLGAKASAEEEGQAEGGLFMTIGGY